MNFYWILAAALTFFIGAAHSILGEKFFLPHVFKKVDPLAFGNMLFFNRTARVAWHLTTLTWWALALLLIFAARDASDNSLRLMVRVVAVLFGVSGIFSLVESRGRHLSWIVFFAIAGMCWLGLIQ